MIEAFLDAEHKRHPENYSPGPDSPPQCYDASTEGNGCIAFDDMSKTGGLLAETGFTGALEDDWKEEGMCRKCWEDTREPCEACVPEPAGGECVCIRICPGCDHPLPDEKQRWLTHKKAVAKIHMPTCSCDLWDFREELRVGDTAKVWDGRQLRPVVVMRIRTLPVATRTVRTYQKAANAAPIQGLQDFA